MPKRRRWRRLYDGPDRPRLAHALMAGAVAGLAVQTFVLDER
jgi:hypothetical protein